MADKSIAVAPQPTFQRHEPVTHWNRFGLQHDYFVRVHDDDPYLALVSDGSDCYESVSMFKLERNHLSAQTYEQLQKGRKKWINR